MSNLCCEILGTRLAEEISVWKTVKKKRKSKNKERQRKKKGREGRRYENKRMKGISRKRDSFPEMPIWESYS
jgi:hypothetical protein